MLPDFCHDLLMAVYMYPSPILSGDTVMVTSQLSLSSTLQAFSRSYPFSEQSVTVLSTHNANTALVTLSV